MNPEAARKALETATAMQRAAVGRSLPPHWYLVLVGVGAGACVSLAMLAMAFDGPGSIWGILTVIAVLCLPLLLRNQTGVLARTPPPSGARQWAIAIGGLGAPLVLSFAGGIWASSAMSAVWPAWVAGAICGAVVFIFCERDRAAAKRFAGDHVRAAKIGAYHGVGPRWQDLLFAAGAGGLVVAPLASGSAYILGAILSLTVLTAAAVNLRQTFGRLWKPERRWSERISALILMAGLVIFAGAAHVDRFTDHDFSESTLRFLAVVFAALAGVFSWRLLGGPKAGA
jgi:uncharacterized integral membrane protein